MKREFKGKGRERNFRPKNKRKDYYDNHKYDEFVTKPFTEGKVQDALSIKALRNLPHSSYSIKADPYTAANSTSEGYNILAPFNKFVGPTYKGIENIDGGNVQQYANSINSKFLHYYDVFRMFSKVNYRYLPIKENAQQRGYNLVDEMRKSISEAISVLQSTTYHQMAINSFAVETDLCLGSGKKKTISGKTVYTGTDALYAMSIYYQTFFQDALSVINWFNSSKLKQGTAIRNAWNREVPALNALFGLFNRKSFTNLLQSICLSFEGEYIDKEFMTQINTMNFIPSRRSNSVTDPVLELQIGWNHPETFKIYVMKEDGSALIDELPFFDDSRLSATVLNEAGVEETMTYWDVCEKLRTYLSLEDVTLWARKNFKDSTIPGISNTRFNYIVRLFDVINNAMVIFKPLWADYREAFDTLARTGVLNWTKGYLPSITTDNDAALFNNGAINDIYNLAFSGAHNLTLDDATMRWRSYSKWSMYNGIPEYDVKQGGAFLMFSFKDTSNLSGRELGYMPRLFENYDETSTYCVAVSRDGVETRITTEAIAFKDNVVISRLAPLTKQEDMKIRIPTVKFDQADTDHKATLYKTLTQLFGLCRVSTGAGDTAYDYAVDPDIIAIYEVEIEDITNMAITYARAYAPFRGTQSDLGDLGFSIPTIK